MKLEKIIKKWLAIWTYVIILISGVIVGFLVCNWNIWSFQTKIFAFATILLPIHVLEEWYFPGGFHTMYNLMKKSKTPDKYPMNQLSDMWTNLIGVIFGCIVLIIGVNPIFMIMQLFLCCAEIFGHTSGGIFSYKKFKHKGKKTLYSPGTFTILFGYVPITVCIIISFVTEEAPAVWQILVALIFSIILGRFSLLGVEKICMNKNTLYGYSWGDGYFEKYL